MSPTLPHRKSSPRSRRVSIPLKYTPAFNPTNTTPNKNPNPDARPIRPNTSRKKDEHRMMRNCFHDSGDEVWLCATMPKRVMGRL